MIKHFIFVTLLAGLTCQTALAGGPDLPPPKSANTDVYRSADRWLISSDIYLWGVNLSGSTTVSGITTEPTAESQEFLHHMRSTGMFGFGASQGPFGMFIQGFYGELKYSQQEGNVENTTRNSFGMIDMGVSYRAYKRILRRNIDDTIQSTFSIVPYFGTRFLIDNVHYYQGGANTTFQDQWWMQPLFGSRFIYQFAKNWDIFANGDLAYWGSNNQSYNTMAMLQYNKLFGVTILTFNIGYRYMYQYRQSDGSSFKWDMNLYGPLFGMSMTI